MWRTDGGLGITSASSELELRRDRKERFEGCECNARWRLSEAEDFIAMSLGVVLSGGGGGGSSGMSLGEGCDCTGGVDAVSGGGTYTVGPNRGDSAGVCGRLGTNDGRPADMAIETTGFLLYLEVGSSTGPFLVDVMEDRVDGLTTDSSIMFSGLLELSPTTLAVPSVLGGLAISPGVSVRTEIFSSIEAAPIDVGRRWWPGRSG